MVELRLANMCSGHLCYRRPFRLLHEEEEEEASLDDHETDSKDLSEDADAVQADDSCEYSNDGECDEPEYCMMGTDTTDCNSELDSQGIRRQGAGSRGGCATERRRKRRRKRSPGLDDSIQQRCMRDDDRWFLFVNGRWPNPKCSSKRGALAIFPSIV